MTKTNEDHSQLILTESRHMATWYESSVAHVMACRQQHQAINQTNTEPSPSPETSFDDIGMGHHWPTLWLVACGTKPLPKPMPTHPELIAYEINTMEINLSQLLFN